MTYSELYTQSRNALSAGGVESPAHEARTLIEALLGLDRIALMDKGNCQVNDRDEKRLFDAVRRRAQGYPLQYLLKSWSFMGRDYVVGEGVLIPRDDTEVAVNTCYESLRGLHSPDILELCSGSGIIAVTLSKLIPDSRITAIELSDSAFAYLEKNVQRHDCRNIKLIHGDVFRDHVAVSRESFDALISNPPYIATGELHFLQREVGYEPVDALNGGEDGLDFYRCIASDWLPSLKQGGSITLEIGEEQADAVSELLYNNGIENIRVIKDIQNLDRVIFGTKKGNYCSSP